VDGGVLGLVRVEGHGAISCRLLGIAPSDDTTWTTETRAPDVDDHPTLTNVDDVDVLDHLEPSGSRDVMLMQHHAILM
jgi:hypothetical protein